MEVDGQPVELKLIHADRGTDSYFQIIQGHPDLVCMCFDVTNNLQFAEITQTWHPELSSMTLS